jgi:hypothetical protein
MYQKKIGEKLKQKNKEWEELYECDGGCKNSRFD